MTWTERIIIAIIVLILAATVFTGCTDAELKHTFTYNTESKVTVWGQNGPVKEWTSTGRVNSETNSDGWYFEDKTTGGFVRVSGNVSVEEIKK